MMRQFSLDQVLFLFGQNSQRKLVHCCIQNLDF